MNSTDTNIQFTHLHVHSEYSLLDGKSKVSELVDKAISDGMRGLALTDHGNMYGVKEFFNYVEKVNSKRPDDDKFKPIIGCEMYVAKERLTDRGDKRDNGLHLIVLAKNEKGYHNLLKLVSKAWTEGMYYKPRTDREELAAHREGLIICSACLGGEVPQLILNGDLEAAEERVKWYKDTFGDDYYLELQRHETFKENANTEVYPEQVKVNKELLRLARKHDIKIVATNDVHFAREEDAEAHDRLICISMQKLYNEPRMHYTKQEWLKNPREMAEIFSDLPEALANTQEILDKVEFYSINHGPIMPNYEIPADFGSEEEYRSRITPEQLYDEFTRDENGNVVMSREEGEKKIARLGGYDKLYRIKFEADYLKKLTYEGAYRLYGNPLPPEVDERLNFELHIMKTMGFPGYFLIVQDFINYGRNNLGVSIGPGRGSAAGSAAAYCLGITQVDPIKYDLLFERFLNPDRISLPDIDVDFDDDGRYRVLDYVTKKYGEEKVAHIVTYGTLATKNVLRDVGKVMGLSPKEVNLLAKKVPDRLPDIGGKAPKINIKNCLMYDPEFQMLPKSEDARVRETVKYAEQLEGTVRGTGVHACGVIICRDDITDWVPVSMTTDSDGSKLIVTQYEGSVIEETGLIKMDFLGLKTLSIIQEALANIKYAKGIDLDIANIPLDDPKTYKLYCDGATTSTFQFESPGMQASLRKLQPSKFEDLIAMNALYRPGPMDYIPSFIDRKHGVEPIVYDIPIMEKYLKETYGITVYQEQVMLLSRLLADFTRGESDMLRKAMGKKQIDKMAKLKVKFIDQGKKNGHAEKVLEKIWADWEKFASYAFNKSHATCYSWVAYQTAYLKANYPEEYMAGVLSRNLDVPDKLKKVMEECARMNLAVKGPDVNESVVKFGVSRNGEIRFGLGAIKGVGQNAVNTILQEREANGPFTDIFDFVERVNLSACNRRAIESLALAGAFDGFGNPREMYVHPVGNSTFSETLVRHGQRAQTAKNSLQFSLFEDEDPILPERPPLPDIVPWSRIKLLEEEKKLVTVFLSGHPLDDYRMELTYGTTDSCDSFNQDDISLGQEVRIGGLVTSLQTKTTKRGDPFGVVTIEDTTGPQTFRLFGQDYANFFHRLTEGMAVMIYGMGAKRGGYYSNDVEFRVQSIKTLNELAGTIANSVTVRIDSRHDDPMFFKTLEKFAVAPGEKPRRSGEIIFTIFDRHTGQNIHVQPRRKFNIDADLISFLDREEIKYIVSTIKE